MTFLRLLLLFTIIPLLELELLFWVADQIGGFETLGIVIITGIIGANLARHQGRMVIRAIQNDLQAGQMPTDHVLSGLLVLVGGVLLVTPGVATDFLGLMLMIPGNRRLIMGPLKKKLASHIQVHSVQTPFGGVPFGSQEKEVDAREINDPPLPPHQ